MKRNRKLLSITTDQAIHLMWLILNDESKDEDIQITKEEIEVTIVHPDGGLMVDGDAALVIEVSCRCFEGQFCIRENGDLELWDLEEDKLMVVRNPEKAYQYLQEKFSITRKEQI